MFTIKQAAKEMGVSINRVYNAFWYGRIAEPAGRVGNVWVFNEAELVKLKEYFAARPAKGGKCLTK